MSDIFDHAFDAYESLMHDEYYHSIDTDKGYQRTRITYDRNNNCLEFELEYIHQTPKAVLLSDGDNQIWLPKSQIRGWDSQYKKGKMVWVEIPEWLAIAKDLC